MSVRRSRIAIWVSDVRPHELDQPLPGTGLAGTVVTGCPRPDGCPAGPLCLVNLLTDGLAYIPRVAARDWDKRQELIKSLSSFRSKWTWLHPDTLGSCRHHLVWRITYLLVSSFGGRDHQGALVTEW